MTAKRTRRLSNYKKQGRKTLFKKAMIKQASNLILMGYTQQKVAEFFQISTTCLYQWKSIYPDFKKAMNINRDDYDGQVVRSLFEVATGYDYVERKKEIEKDELGKKSKTKITKTKKHIPPNVGAIKVWLYNRRPSEFKPEPALSTREDTDQAPAPPLIINYNVNPPVKCVKVTVGKDG